MGCYCLVGVGLVGTGSGGATASGNCPRVVSGDALRTWELP